MAELNRRGFLELGVLGGVLGTVAPSSAEGVMQHAIADVASDPDDRLVRFSGDGLGLTPAQYSQLLSRLASEKAIVPDAYILDGIVAELEEEYARILAKERAIFIPTGTLANHMAVRALAGGPSRVIVQAESHLYQDSGDCVQTLSNITLVPLAPGGASFTADDVQQVLDQTRAGRVLSRVSVISVETPVRRRRGQMFDPGEMTKVATLARRQGIRLHLDGARLFLQSAYTGTPVADYARPFDTVYVSLYKYFNAASGAILAGPRDLLDGMFHVRRMFGGSLYQAWPFAVVALHYLGGFSERFVQAVRTSEEVLRGLEREKAITIERIPLGTNLFRLRLTATDSKAFQKRLLSAGVVLPAPAADGSFLIGVNETWNRSTASALTDSIRKAANS